MDDGPKGPPFSKVFARGWEALASLTDDRAASKLYIFLASACGHDNAVVCTYDTLAKELDLSERTIRRAVRRLEDSEHVVVLRVGSACAYVLNPDEVWSTVEGHKRFCSFRTRTLVSFDDNPLLRRRITHAFSKRRAGEMSTRIEDDAQLELAS